MCIRDRDWEAEIVLEVIEDIPFDTDAELIGISTMGHGVIRSIDIARKFREMGKTVILGCLLYTSRCV